MADTGPLVVTCPRCGYDWSAHFEHVCFHPHCKTFHTIGPMDEICYKMTKAEAEDNIVREMLDNQRAGE